MRSGFGRSDAAVSDVIGTVLLLGITVGAFSVLSAVVLDQFDRNPPPARVEFRVDTFEGRTSITSVWGESVRVEDTRLVFDANEVRILAELQDPSLLPHLTHRIPDSSASWDVGESLRLGCLATEPCAYPGKKVTNISVIQRSTNSVIFSTEQGVSQGAYLNAAADLVVTLEAIRDPLRPLDPLFVGGTITTTVKVRNAGVVEIPGDRVFDVQFFLDGSNVPFYTQTKAGGLTPGASFVITTTPFSAPVGAHAVRARVDANPSVIEAGYGNNEIQIPFQVIPGIFDPAGPYEDGNDDLLYNPYTAGDVLLAPAVVKDGVHTASANKNLVIPPSTGTIATPGSISFSAPSGRLVIRVGLETLNPVTSMTLTASNGVNITGTYDVKTRDALTITSGGNIDLSGIRLDTNSDPIVVRSTGGRVYVTNTAFFIAGVSTLPSSVKVEAQGQPVYLSGARFEVEGTGTALHILSSAQHLQGARLVANSPLANIVLELGANNRAYVAQAFFDDADNIANLQPSSACAVGTPSFGGVSQTC